MQAQSGGNRIEVLVVPGIFLSREQWDICFEVLGTSWLDLNAQIPVADRLVIIRVRVEIRVLINRSSHALLQTSESVKSPR